MSKGAWILIWLYLTWILHESYLLVPHSEIEYQPFPFSEQWLTKQSYVFLACKYAIALILVAIIHSLMVEYRHITIWFVWFQFLELGEYFLTYNRELFSQQIIASPIEFSVGINITNIKIAVMFIIIAKELIWNRGKDL
jgi:hypothetical protein